MRHIIHRQCVFLIYCPLLVLGYVLLSEVVLAQTKIPLEGQSGIIEKSLSSLAPLNLSLIRECILKVARNAKLERTLKLGL